MNQENEVFLFLGNETVNGKWASYFQITVKPFRELGERFGWEIWAKVIQELFVLCLRFFYKSEIISK